MIDIYLNFRAGMKRHPDAGKGLFFGLCGSDGRELSGMTKKIALYKCGYSGKPDEAPNINIVLKF